jgi:FG-GAP-like repeat/FlgD Ig-like domain/FG-GAP repeat
VIADLDGDGKQDLVVGSSGSESVAILLGNGDGTFAAKSDINVVSGPVAVGDLDQDGRPDLVVAVNGNLRVMPGNGDGTFGAGTDFPAFPGGVPGISIAIADLNQDGRPDLAATDENSQAFAVDVLLGNGVGTFGASHPYATGRLPLSLAIEDLNGDGRLDLALVNAADSTISVLLGNGDGSFGTKRDYFTGGFPSSIAIGDVNRDGRPDLAVANRYSSLISVLLNTGGVRYIGVDPAPGVLPQVFDVLAPRPNPARGAVQLAILLPAACAVDIDLLDIAGRRVRSLKAGEALPAGRQVVTWDGRTQTGTLAPSGVYLVRVRAGRDAAVRKVVLLK